MTQEVDSRHLQRLIINKKIESVIESFPVEKKKSGSDGFTSVFYQTLKEELTPMFHKLIYKKKKKIGGNYSQLPL